MEKRIKALYIITILAILVFLGMQVYWLFGRYVFSLNEYERDLSQKIIECVKQYNGLRESPKNRKNIADTTKKEMMFPVISLSISKGDSIKTSRRVSIYTYSYHKILGLDTNIPLTKEMKEKAVNNVYDHTRYNREIASDSVHYDASPAKDENETWAAAHNVVLAKDVPFTAVGIDSVFRKNGINADLVITQVDSMVWKNNIQSNGTIWNPMLSVSIPFSQLEGKIVNIKCKINPFDVLPMMWPTLAVVLLVTILLNVCLVLQFSTVLKLSRLDKMRNSFITTMIHELKRPISTLKMCVSGLDNKRMMEDKELKKDILLETRIALDNLSAYFSKLRDITFNDVEQIPLNIETFNLRKLTDIVIKVIIVPSDKVVSLVNEIDADIEVSADKSHLHNILINLVENAIKYSKESVDIVCTASKTDNSIEISVKDNGIGISPIDQKHIFKRFYRGKASVSDQPGIGLGLTYVKLLVDAHGGEITVDSTEGEGTRFTIKLPQ